jgi:cell division initiation protein
MITPVDLETTVFRRNWRGYNTKEVQEFMNRIVQDYEYLYRENINLKEKIEELNLKLNNYQLMDESLRNALILAQKNADDVIRIAQSQAQLIIQDAEHSGEELKLQLRSEIQSELQNLANLKNQTEFFRSQFKGFLNSLLELSDKQLDLEIVWSHIKQNMPPVDKTKYMTEAAAASETVSIASEPEPDSESNA